VVQLSNMLRDFGGSAGVLILILSKLDDFVEVFLDQRGVFP
jgi:hypothetical protein